MKQIVMRTRYSDISAYRTKDGSQIRELMHPDRHGNRAQSLAEAIVFPGQETLLHKHLTSEELYHVISGHGLMTLDRERFEVEAGDTVLIAPRAAHCIANIGAEPLRILCCCSPAYSDEDTVILTGADGAALA
jgi:mannose-6-phosphate isomerase-like protein (cupin superfamily)